MHDFYDERKTSGRGRKEGKSCNARGPLRGHAGMSMMTDPQTGAGFFVVFSKNKK